MDRRAARAPTRSGQPAEVDAREEPPERAVQCELRGENLQPLFEAIVDHVPPPRGNPEAPLQILVANLDSSDYLGRIAIGRIFNGTVNLNDPVAVLKLGGATQQTKITKLFAFDGLKRIEVQRAMAGDIVCLAGIEDITIGETIASVDEPVAIPPIAIDEPTVSMIFGVNTSPMAGRDGQYVTSRNLRDRLTKELLGNVSIRLEDTDSPESVKVVGRGELQLSILIEMMRREGYELQASRPEIVTREVNGQRVEPVEDLVIDVPEDFQGVVIAQVGGRRGAQVAHRSSASTWPRSCRASASARTTTRLPVFRACFSEWRCCCRPGAPVLAWRGLPAAAWSHPIQRPCRPFS